MSGYISVNDRLKLAELENSILKGENEKLRADSDYIAMMTDVDLDETEENEHE